MYNKRIYSYVRSLIILETYYYQILLFVIYDSHCFGTLIILSFKEIQRKPSRDNTANTTTIRPII